MRLVASQINGTFAARVTGLDPERPERSLSAERAAELQELLRQYKVLVFEDIPVLSPAQLLALGRIFGELDDSPHPTLRSVEGHPAVRLVINDTATVVDKSELVWHTDGLGERREFSRSISLLQAVDVPPFGRRDTMYADMEAAFERLSPPMQRFVEGLTGIHSWGSLKADAIPSEHPMVKQDAKTGRKALYANTYYTKAIKGLNAQESATLLGLLAQLPHAPEIQARVSWKPGTMVIWDNEKTQHYLVHDYPYRRVMHRVMASPDLPVK
jgi:taurine dioxygenase